MFTQPITKIESEMADGKETQKVVETDRISIYREVEKEDLEGKKVVIKELVRETTFDEIRADIENLRNNARDLENQATELEALLNN